MSPDEHLFLAAGDGYRLAYRRYAPPAGAKPRGLVVYLHGIQSHGGWYEASCRHLAAAGLAVYFADRRGSGLNAVGRGDAESWEQLAGDVTALEERAVADWWPAAGRLPLFLAAVSWGGKLAAALARMHADRYAGLVLLCPGICAKRGVSAWTKLQIAKAVLGGHGAQLFPLPLGDPGLFTATPQWLDYLQHDELSLREATARFLFASRRLDDFMATTPEWIHVPTYLALAGHDDIIDNEKTRWWFQRVAAADKTVNEYSKAHHTLEFEPEPEPIFNDLASWILGRT
jgi:alpha-beta hydrolase superfamily lysophospholipase